MNYKTNDYEIEVSKNTQNDYVKNNYYKDKSFKNHNTQNLKSEVFKILFVLLAFIMIIFLYLETFDLLTDVVVNEKRIEEQYNDKDKLKSYEGK